MTVNNANCAAAENSPAAPSHPVADWNPVPPVKGFWRPFDTFFGPGMTAREWIVLWGGTALGCVGMVVLWVREDARQTFSVTALVWAFLATYDVIGGVMTLATNSGKRWYNSTSERTCRARLSFLGLHIVHLGIIAFLVLPAGGAALGFAPWWWFVLNLAMLYGFGAMIEFTGLDIQRPVAFGLVVVALMVNLNVVPLPLVLSLFVPLFYIKLFVGFIPVESPWRTRPPAPPLNMTNRGWGYGEPTSDRPHPL